MGSFISTNGSRGEEEERNTSNGVATESGWEETQPVNDDSADVGVRENCAIICNKSENLSENSVVESSFKDDEPDEFESCDGGEQNDKLADFREEIARHRELRKVKMAEIRQEMDQLRKDLEEEKSKNLTLVQYIQGQDQTKQLPAEVLVAVNGSCENDHVEDLHNDTERQSDSSADSSSDSISQDETRRALRKDLAESQLHLQQANAEILSLQDTIDQLKSQAQTNESAQEDHSSELRKLKAELAELQFQLQISNAETLSLQTVNDQLRNQIKSLKEVIKAGKEIITIREDQVDQLKAKLRQIEDSLHERELQIMSTDLRREYERQMTNIRNLRELYEERERVSRMERDNLLRQLELRKNDLDAELEKNKNLESHVTGLQTDLEATKAELYQTKEKLAQSVAECHQLQAEMTVVNQFISKFLLGMGPNRTADQVKLDKLTSVLAENRDLLIEMTKEEAETIDLGAFLPRALYDLVSEVDQEEQQQQQQQQRQQDDSGEPTSESSLSGEEFSQVQTASPEQIADKLPKVWRVLIELVNHQEQVEPVPFVENGESEECLKSVPTKNGSKTVVSVSKTYLKLKDLILEKKALKKETNRLKTLNTHLERRLETQEKRLSAVSLELTKTWHLVGKMQRQHRQLHTQEQILRYHLQQKRRLLSELKEELEYCRLKWSAARQKNTESEEEWRQLKADFAARKKQDSFNQSGESGYSDEQATDDEDDTSIKGSKKQTRKDFLARMACLENRFRSASLSNVLQVALELRKCHSESDMKSLSNVERANQFCNEKIEDLPLFPEECDCTVKMKTKKVKKKKDKKSGPETAEEMFKRLAGIPPDSNDDEEDDSETELTIDSECSEIEKIEGNGEREKEGTQNQEPALTSEELFNLKREARLKRMAELNNQLDNYSSAASSSKDTSSNVTEENASDSEPTQVLTSTEEEYLQRRAARLERLEREAQEFRNRLKRTVNRGSQISAQIDDIHNGFMARQSESPIPGSSTSAEPNRSQEMPAEDLATLSEREQEYTQSRSDRLHQLEVESQSLINKMSKTLERGSNLNSHLDKLHSRYGSNDQQSGGEQPEDAEQESSTRLVEQEHQELTPQEPATAESVLLENSITMPSSGPIELILISDEEILEEVDEVQPTPSNATSSQEDETNHEE
ncbi:restin homolog [Uranotaenia lowii]|uniref:restin homolog n=1 Tax=Uranotaenia lowii TaxID=190385 RepID=UPI00247B2B5F|nr:restin homolog [Uranotaenia lowii]